MRARLPFPSRFPLLRTAVLLGFAVYSLSSFAQQQQELAAEAQAVPQIEFTRFTLPNQMRVILSEDHSVPVVTEAMIFNVGGRDEHRSRSGFAHLFEHLMFEGSLHAPKGVFDHLVEGFGGNDNASTHEDYTFYYENAPSNVLPLLMWLDADRLANLNVTAENMKNQISVVEEEKRLRVDNQPYGDLQYIAISEAAFRNWQNAHPVIGSFQDLDAATLQDVRSFFNSYYAPRNAILAIVGDFDSETVKKEVTRYFGFIPNRGTIAPVSTTEPPQTAEQHKKIADPHANVPALAIAWQGPPRNTPAFYALSVLGELLFSGKSSRLYQSLVKQRQIAIGVDGGLGFPQGDFTDYRAPGLFSGMVLYKPGVSDDLVEQLVFREIHEIVANGVSKDELDRVKTKIRADWIRSEQTTLDRSQLLLLAALFDNDPATANTELMQLLSVTSADIEKAAQEYLTHPRTTVIVDVPGTTTTQPPPPAPTTGN